MQLISRFLRDETGATAIEYCLIAVGVSIVIITAVNNVGSSVNAKFSAISTSLE
jgi:pilus assembly protein Flp/PilA